MPTFVTIWTREYQGVPTLLPIPNKEPGTQLNWVFGGALLQRERGGRISFPSCRDYLREGRLDPLGRVKVCKT